MAPLCKIIFDNPHNIYFAGETVTGKVEVTVEKPTKIKGILLHIKSGADVLWIETTNTSDGTRGVMYTNEEQYFETKHYCVGGGTSEEVTLPSGTQTYAFAFPLPPNLPSSFEGPHGNIRYKVVAIMERPWKKNLKTKIIFTVISHYDLNTFPNLLSEAKVSADKYYCCWCCKNGPVTAVVQIPKTGYVCGERIPVLIDIDNASTVYINNVILFFNQVTFFHANKPYTKVREDSITFGEIILGSVDKRGSKTWTQMLEVPPLPPSNVNECKIIVSEYQVLLFIGTGIRNSLKASIPIIIGTIPFTKGNYTLPPQYEAVIKNEDDASQIGGTGAPESSIPTQNFSENKFINAKMNSADKARGDEDLKNFSPMYPTYNFKY